MFSAQRPVRPSPPVPLPSAMGEGRVARQVFAGKRTGRSRAEQQGVGLDPGQLQRGTEPRCLRLREREPGTSSALRNGTPAGVDTRTRVNGRSPLCMATAKWSYRTPGFLPILGTKPIDFRGSHPEGAFVAWQLRLEPGR